MELATFGVDHVTITNLTWASLGFSRSRFRSLVFSPMNHLNCSILLDENGPFKHQYLSPKLWWWARYCLGQWFPKGVLWDEWKCATGSSCEEINACLLHTNPVPTPMAFVAAPLRLLLPSCTLPAPRQALCCFPASIPISQHHALGWRQSHALHPDPFPLLFPPSWGCLSACEICRSVLISGSCCCPLRYRTGVGRVETVERAGCNRVRPCLPGPYVAPAKAVVLNLISLKPSIPP